MSSPTDGLLDALTVEQRLFVKLLVSDMLEYFEGGDWYEARQIWLTAPLDNDERAASFELLDSKQRAYLKGEDRKYLNEEQ